MTPRQHDPAPPRAALARGFRGRCPRCGAAALFARWARPRDACPSCGLVFRREQGAMTGSMYLSAVVTEILAAVLVLAIFFATDWTPTVSLAVSVPVVVVFSAWWLPRSIGLWVAIEYLTDVANREPWTAVDQRSRDGTARDEDPARG